MLIAQDISCEAAQQTVGNVSAHLQPCLLWSMVCFMTLSFLACLSTWEWEKEKDGGVMIDPALGHSKKTHMQWAVIKAPR